MHKTDEVIEDKHRRVVADYFSTKTDFWDLVYDESHPATGLSLVQKDDMLCRKESALRFLDKVNTGTKLNILDIGCGTGTLMQSMWSRGHHVEGVDISEKMVEVVLGKIQRETADAFCRTAPAEALPFETGSMDVVSAMGLIEYLYDPSKGISEINRVLKPGGYWILSLPNIIRIKNLLDPYYYFVRSAVYILSKLNKSKYRQSDHLLNISSNSNFSNRRFYLRGFVKTASAAGFELEEVESIGFGPFTFWKKNIFSDPTTIKLSRWLTRRSHTPVLGFLKMFPNRWVFKFKKIRNV